MESSIPPCCHSEFSDVTIRVLGGDYPRTLAKLLTRIGILDSPCLAALPLEQNKADLEEVIIKMLYEGVLNIPIPACAILEDYDRLCRVCTVRAFPHRSIHTPAPISPVSPGPRNSRPPYIRRAIFLASAPTGSDVRTCAGPSLDPGVPIAKSDRPTISRPDARDGRF